MVRKAVIKELIIAKKLLENSFQLIENDTLENNLIAVTNLNSALDIFLRILSTHQKIKSVKQLDKLTLEKQWTLLSKKYKQYYGETLSMKNQIFILNNIISEFIMYTRPILKFVISAKHYQSLCTNSQENYLVWI